MKYLLLITTAVFKKWSKLNKKKIYKNLIPSDKKFGEF